MTTTTREEVVDFLSRLNPLEVRALVLELEDRWGIERPHDGAPPLLVMGVPLAFPEYEVILVAPGPRRVQVMRALRELLGGSLADVRALVDGGPRRLLDRAELARAEALAAALRAVGATIEVKEEVW
ncbi:MAG: ribosomal protein L7/L12 [Nannocystaceae bacterium]